MVVAPVVSMGPCVVVADDDPSSPHAAASTAMSTAARTASSTRRVMVEGTNEGPGVGREGASEREFEAVTGSQARARAALQSGQGACGCVGSYVMSAPEFVPRTAVGVAK